MCGIPDVKSKEPWYFGTSPLSLKWYKCLFPIRKNQKLACDASTSLLPSLLAPIQISYVLPDTKFIAILRDPVDRALSHYEFDKRRGIEVPASFEHALELEHARIKKGDTPTIREQIVYMMTGHYAAHLERWFSVFDRKQFLILTTEELQEDRQKVADKIFNFLNLTGHNITNVKDSNRGKYTNMRPETRRMLIEYYRPHNEQLYNLLGRRFDWS